MLTNPTCILNIAGAIITKNELDVDVEIIMNTSFEPDTFTLFLYNVDDTFRRNIKKGNVTNIQLGYETGFRSSIITGIITKINNEDDYESTVLVVEGIDEVIYKLKKTDINKSFNTPNDVINIIRELCILSGVILSPQTVLSGVILENYTIENTSAYDAISNLTNRIGYNATAKNSYLYITDNVSISGISTVISEQTGYSMTIASGLSQDGKHELSGYDFMGSGLPSLIPLRLVLVAMAESRIFGSYLVETVIHRYNSKTGYISKGVLIESNSMKENVKTVQYPTSKSLATVIGDKINKTFNNGRSIDTGEVEQSFTDERLITSRIGIDKTKIKSITTPSIEAEIGINKTFLIKKPLSSIFAGNGFGLITPVYFGMRPIVGFNRYDFQDANILNFLWKKGWTIPLHDKGDYMLHHINHSKYVMKEDGSEIKQIKSLKIQIGDNGLTAAKPTKGTDKTYLIEFDDGAKISYDPATKIWLINPCSGGKVKLAGGGIAVARLGDDVLIDTALKTYINTHQHPSAAPGPPTPPVIPFTGILTGQINEGSGSVEVD